MNAIVHRALGRSTLQISRLCLGAMMFGGETDEPTAARIIASAHAAGINFIDTADAYHAGASEAVVGRAIAGQRGDWVLASKFGYGRLFLPERLGEARANVILAAEASLARLGTDYLDILYFHRPLPGVAIEEPLSAVGALLAAGKIRHYGLSNFSGWQIAETCRVADALGIDRPLVSQPLYNIANRSAEVEQLPAAGHYGLGVVPYSPLARGVLSGKYAAGRAPPPDSRAGRGDVRMAQTEWRDESLALAAAVGARAAELGISTIAYALGWILNNTLVSAAIAGPRTEAQWDAYLAALEATLGPGEEAFIDALVPPGHASTPGHTDPAYPVAGRVV